MRGFHIIIRLLKIIFAQEFENPIGEFLNIVQRAAETKVDYGPEGKRKSGKLLEIKPLSNGLCMVLLNKTILEYNPDCWGHRYEGTYQILPHLRFFIFNPDTNKIVAIGDSKFSQEKSPTRKALGNEPVEGPFEASQKVDGTCVAAYVFQGKWYTSTLGTDKEMTATIALKFFLEKCKIVPQEGLFFTFEVVWGSTTFAARSSDGGVHIYLLGVLNMETLEYLSPEACDGIASKYGIKRPLHFSFVDMAEMKGFLDKATKSHAIEGLVAYAIGSDETLKVKPDSYFYRDSQSMQVNLKDLLDWFLKEGTLSDFLRMSHKITTDRGASSMKFIIPGLLSHYYEYIWGFIEFAYMSQQELIKKVIELMDVPLDMKNLNLKWKMFEEILETQMPPNYPFSIDKDLVRAYIGDFKKSFSKRIFNLETDPASASYGTFMGLLYYYEHHCPSSVKAAMSECSRFPRKEEYALEVPA